MKVSGFSFIKNAIKYHYPVAEALQSILPLCDEIIVAEGNSEDETRQLISLINGKIKIIDTVWDETQKKEGKVFAAETDKAFNAVSPDSDWCIYIQGDEVIHEKYYAEVLEAMHRWKDDENVDGLLFKYKHFYGSYDYTSTSSHWYKQEIRVIKNNRKIYSYRDAQGFRKNNNEKLHVKPLNAFIYHYGWVREPRVMRAKTNNFQRYWKGDAFSNTLDKLYPGEFNYSEVDALQKFIGTHPQVMMNRINKMNWKFDFDPSCNKLSLKDKIKNTLEKLTGSRPLDYKNYRIV